MTYGTDTEACTRCLCLVDRLNDSGKVSLPLSRFDDEGQSMLIRSHSWATYVENPLVQVAGRNCHKVAHC